MFAKGGISTDVGDAHCTPHVPHLQIQDALSKLFGQVGMLDTPVPIGTAASCTCFQRICLCVQVGALFFVPWLVAPHAKPEHTPVALCKVASRAAIASALDGRHRLACETHPCTHARTHARPHVCTYARSDVCTSVSVGMVRHVHKVCLQRLPSGPAPSRCTTKPHARSTNIRQTTDTARRTPHGHWHRTIHDVRHTSKGKGTARHTGTGMGTGTGTGTGSARRITHGHRRSGSYIGGTVLNRPSFQSHAAIETFPALQTVLDRPRYGSSLGGMLPRTLRIGCRRVSRDRC